MNSARCCGHFLRHTPIVCVCAVHRASHSSRLAKYARQARRCGGDPKKFAKFQFVNLYDFPKKQSVNWRPLAGACVTYEFHQFLRPPSSRELSRHRRNRRSPESGILCARSTRVQAQPAAIYTPPDRAQPDLCAPGPAAVRPAIERRCSQQHSTFLCSSLRPTTKSRRRYQLVPRPRRPLTRNPQDLCEIPRNRRVFLELWEPLSSRSDSVR